MRNQLQIKAVRLLSNVERVICDTTPYAQASGSTVIKACIADAGVFLGDIAEKPPTRCEWAVVLGVTAAYAARKSVRL